MRTPVPPRVTPRCRSVGVVTGLTLRFGAGWPIGVMCGEATSAS